MKKVLLCAWLLLALVPRTLSGQAPAEPDPCANPSTTPAVGACLHKQLDAADAEMNRVYREVLSALEDEGAKSELRKAQRAWLAYRDASAGFMEAWYRGGTGVGAYRTQHVLELTKERTATLRSFLDTP